MWTTDEDVVCHNGKVEDVGQFLVVCEEWERGWHGLVAEVAELLELGNG